MNEKNTLPVPSQEDVAIQQRLQALLCSKWVAEPVIVSAGVRPFPE